MTMIDSQFREKPTLEQMVDSVHIWKIMHKNQLYRMKRCGIRLREADAPGVQDIPAEEKPKNTLLH